MAVNFLCRLRLRDCGDRAYHRHHDSEQNVQQRRDHPTRPTPRSPAINQHRLSGRSTDDIIRERTIGHDLRLVVRRFCSSNSQLSTAASTDGVTIARRAIIYAVLSSAIGTGFNRHDSYPISIASDSVSSPIRTEGCVSYPLATAAVL